MTGRTDIQAGGIQLSAMVLKMVFKIIWPSVSINELGKEQQLSCGALRETRREARESEFGRKLSRGGGLQAK